jgi:hypothetical protein
MDFLCVTIGTVFFLLTGGLVWLCGAVDEKEGRS